jgi:hypothetical protein
MNLKYMMLKDKYLFSYGPQLSLFSSEDDKKRSLQISLYLKELTLYHTSLAQLIKHTPSDKIRNELLNIAIICSQDVAFYESIRNNRNLPLKKLSDFTYKSRQFIEKWQYYILAYFILLSSDNYINIRGYLNIRDSSVKKEANNITSLQALNSSASEKNKFTGIILKAMKNSAIILTAQGNYVKISPHESSRCLVGSICTGKIKRDLWYFRYPIFIALIILFLSLLLGVRTYLKPARTILINGNSSIKIKSNAWDKVVEIKPLSANGEKITESLSLFNKSIDSSIYTILKSAYDKQIINENTPITIFISGSKKETPDLNKSSEYILDNKLKISINNNGIEHKIKKP